MVWSQMKCLASLREADENVMSCFASIQSETKVLDTFDLMMLLDANPWDKYSGLKVLNKLDIQSALHMAFAMMFSVKLHIQNTFEKKQARCLTSLHPITQWPKCQTV